MNKSIPFFVFSIFLLTIIGKTALFILPEGQQAIVTQFGRPMGTAKKDAGLYMKLPWQDVRYLEKRILNWDGSPNQIVTKDKKYISADTTARWQIADPLQFIRTVQNENLGTQRITAIIDSTTRDIISGHNLVEAVRNGNQILDSIKQKKLDRELAVSSGDLINIVEEEITGEIEIVQVGREKLSSIIVDEAREKLKEMGIALIDVQLRRITYEESVQAKVYERMVSERQRAAEKIRSVGKGEQAKIFGKTERELQEINSEAYRKVQQLNGDAEGQAVKIYADAVQGNEKFYEFARTLDSYRKGFQGNTKLILSSQAEFLKLLTEGEVE